MRKSRGTAIVTSLDEGEEHKITAPTRSAITIHGGSDHEFKCKTEALEAKNLLYGMLIEGVPQGICLFNREARLVLSNRRYAEIYRLTPALVLPGTTSQDAAEQREVACPSTTTSEASAALSCLANSNSTSRTSTVELKDGRTIRICHQPTPDGGWVSTHEDISALKVTRAAVDEQISLQTLIDWMPEYLWIKDLESRFVVANNALATDNGKSAARDMVGLTDFDLHAPELAREFYEFEQGIIRSGQPMVNREESIVDASGATKWYLSTKVPLRGENGNIFGLLGISRDITSRKVADDLLRLLRSAVTHSSDSIQIVHTSPDGASITAYANPALWRTTGWRPEDLIGRSIGAMTGWVDACWDRALAHVASGDESAMEVQVPHRDGRLIWLEASAKVVEQHADGSFRWVLVSRNVDDRKRAEAEIKRIHSDLVIASRQAGKAEIATNVLHNVGNVLNSVNVSATVVADSVRKSKISVLAKAVTLLKEHEHELDTYLSDDPRGKLLPAYLIQLSAHLQADQEEALRELTTLGKNIEHIKEIVAMQQAYAGTSNAIEIVDVREIVEEALRVNTDSVAGLQLEVARDIEDVPPARLDKHKVLEILVNLIGNAQQACAASERTDKRMELRVANGDRRISVAVTDNGVGIPPDNLAKIFNHGFTTKKDGHGFGLHSAALAAKQMGGSLRAQSDGAGQGATFTLELPLEPSWSL